MGNSTPKKRKKEANTLGLEVCGYLCVELRALQFGKIYSIDVLHVASSQHLFITSASQDGKLYVFRIPDKDVRDLLKNKKVIRNKQQTVFETRNEKAAQWSSCRHCVMPLRSAWVMTVAMSPKSVEVLASGGLDNIVTLTPRNGIGWTVNTHNDIVEVVGAEYVLFCAVYVHNKYI